jgi:formylglycine-generating enzyme
LWGQLDLAGNAWEWALDLYDGTYSDPCTDCADLQSGSGRIVRGGDFEYPEGYLEPIFRGAMVPYNRTFLVGARCARAP